MSKSFYYLISAYTITMLGSKIGALAQMFKSFEISQAIYGISVLLLLRMGTTIIMNPVNFKILKTFNLKKIILFSEFTNGIITFLIFFYSNNFLSLVILATISSALNGIFRPAFFSLISEVEKKENLNKANSILSSIDTIVLFLGYSLSGALILYKGIKATFLIDAFSYFFSLPLYFFINSHSLKSKTSTNHKESYLEFFKNNPKLIRFINLNFIVWTVCGFFSAIEIPFLKNIVCLNDKIIGQIFSISAIGNLSGVFLYSKIFKKSNNIKNIYFFNSFLIIVLPIIYTILTTKVSFLIYSFISGILMVILKNSLNTFIFSQEIEYQGSYFNHLFLINHVGMAMGLIIATFVKSPLFYVSSIRSISLISILIFILFINLRKEN